MSKPFLVAYPFSLGIPQLALPTGALFGCQTGSLFDCQFQAALILRPALKTSSPVKLGRSAGLADNGEE
jgi:hypothetical protein